MKKMFFVCILGLLLACSGNQSGDIKTTDQDRTDNDDTSAQPKNLPDSIRNNSDTTHL